MKITLYSFSHTPPQWITEGINDYAKRFTKDFPLDFVEMKPENRQGGKSIETLLAIEADRFWAQFQKKTPKALLVVLDERGQNWTTNQLSQWIEQKTADYAHIAFLIGSADGLTPDIKQKAHVLLRLSSMTLPHGLAKVLLVEQLYRAIAKIRNHPYHRE